MGKKILIGEDERPMAKALELKLNRSGFDAKAVNDGEEVLKALKEDKYDLLFLDLIMPKVDGFGVLEELKKRGEKVPVIILSNLSQTEDEKRAKELGAIDFFIKSNTPISEVVNHARDILGN
jgi:DNA-binding response OmpR family regulator